jgi:hypothetical protein
MSETFQDPLQSNAKLAYDGKQNIDMATTNQISTEASKELKEDELVIQVIENCSIASLDLTEKRFDSQKECDKFWSDLFYQQWVKTTMWTQHCDDDMLYPLLR